MYRKGDHTTCDFHKSYPPSYYYLTFKQLRMDYSVQNMILVSDVQ